ncbi:MAG: hypothetical protein WCO84_02350 [bacterium]
MLTRILIDFFLLYLTFFSPGFAFMLIGFISAFNFENYYEFLFLSFVVDILFGVQVPSFYGFKFIFTAFSAVTLLISGIIRERVRTF